MTGEIKAIETSYKGYRFRSRLEARWAVFFENAGITWDYETEGFDLGGSLGWYLPDFYLPLLKVWIEIKPASYSSERKRIYMAGKIQKNGWRERLVKDIQDYPPPSPGETLKLWRYEMDYVGPFFVSCDHGCSHGNKTHGVAESCCIDKKELQSVFGVKLNTTNGYSYYVAMKCLESIGKADTVFFWIDCIDCYATLVEFGYAYSLKKDLRVGVSNSIKSQINYTDCKEEFETGHIPLGNHELWFLKELATKFVFSDSVNDAFDILYQNVIPESERKIKTVADSKSERYSLIYGDPLEFRCDGMHISPEGLKISQSTFDFAAQKARSARFEHGESG